jgi:hypothetical protein
VETGALSGGTRTNGLPSTSPGTRTTPLTTTTLGGQSAAERAHDRQPLIGTYHRAYSDHTVLTALPATSMLTASVTGAQN